MMTILASASDSEEQTFNSPEVYLNCLKVKLANETQSTSPGEVESVATSRMNRGGAAFALLSLTFVVIWSF